jgi:hypothetical protein
MAERFTLLIRRDKMIVIDLGYRKVALTKEKAMLLMECLESAEIYEEKYWSEDRRKELGMTETYTYHVYPNDANFSMQIVSDSKYQMAKLAGKP